MDAHELIRTRRSIRKYTDDPVPPEKLRKVLEAIQWAPSWVNFQPWEVVVVDDPELKSQLQDCIIGSNPGRKAIAMAPVVLAVCGRQGISGGYDKKMTTVYGDWVMFDLGIACQNACLAAWEQGLGTLHLGLLDHVKAAEVLNLPDTVKLYELMPLGTPAREGKAPPRKELVEFAHVNQFGEPYSG